MTSTRVQIVSDLHLEEAVKSYNFFPIPRHAPYLVLLGGIGCVADDGYFYFLHQMLLQFQIVFLVVGNQELAYSNVADVFVKLYQFQEFVELERNRYLPAPSLMGQFVLLDHRRFDLSPTVTLLGCTLYSHVEADQINHIEFALKDHYHLTHWSIEEHNDRHANDVAWLNKEVEDLSKSAPDRKLVILTHYSPTTDRRAKHSPTGFGPSGFMTDLSRETCWTAGKAGNKIWVFGNTHHNCEYMDRKTGNIVSTNQMSFFDSQAEGFDIGKCYEI